MFGICDIRSLIFITPDIVAKVWELIIRSHTRLYHELLERYTSLDKR